MDYSYFKNEEHQDETKNEAFIKISNSTKWFFKITLPILLICLFYSLYSGALDNLIYSPEYVFIPAAFVLFFIPIIIYNIFKFWIKSENGSVFGSIFTFLAIIHCPFFAYWTGKHEQNVYRKSGIITNAKVTESFYRKGHNMRYQFTLDDKTYTSFNVSNNGKHKVGDTIKIVYNKHNPEMNSALESLED